MEVFEKDEAKLIECFQFINFNIIVKDNNKVISIFKNFKNIKEINLEICHFKNDENSKEDKLEEEKILNSEEDKSRTIEIIKNENKFLLKESIIFNNTAINDIIYRGKI